MRYTVVLRGARGSSGPLPQALIKVEKRGAVPRPQNLRMGEGGPRWEARHSCGLPLSLCGAHDPRRATLVTSPVAAHTLTSSVGGGGVRDRATWSESNPAMPRRHSWAYLGANTLSLRGGGRRDRARHRSEHMVPRATQRAEAPLMRRTSARVRSFPACATSTTKSLPPCRCFGTRAGLRPRWHFTYVASSDAANTALGGITTDCSPPGAAILSRLTSGLRSRRHFAYAATSHAAYHTPLDALQLIRGRGEPLKARQSPPTFEAAGQICGRLRSRCLAPSADDEALHRGAAHRSWPSAGCVSR